MTRKRVYLAVGLLAGGLLVAVPFTLFKLRYCRTVVLPDLTATQSKTVSLAFRPYHMRWSVSGYVQGTGTVMISHVLSNRVRGSFSINSYGDYYDTNVTVLFIPDGKASGRLRASFFLNNFY